MVKLTNILIEQLSLPGGVINGAPSTEKVKKVKKSLSTDRDYVYKPVREQDTMQMDQQIQQSKNMPIVQRIALINQIRRQLGERFENMNSYTLQENGIAKINGHRMGIEIQSTPEGLQKGLMFRDEIPSGKGMLLKFGKNHPAKIWMKNVKQPLDIIYIKDNQVEDLFKNAMPDMGDGMFDNIEEVICDMVLELPAGDIDKFDIKPGDMFGFNDLRRTNINQ
tara:strand:- start:1572 stop:2237 length:666 start_codon:yes stop_codon:yes gene_type:complete